MEAKHAVKKEARNCTVGTQTIRGHLFQPEMDEKRPLLICSHGYGSTGVRVEPYAVAAAEQGMAAYTFDFRGGGEESASDGETTDMSVMTEVTDLEAVLEQAAGWPEVDASRIALLGASQGGYVSAVTAARKPAEVSALVLLYPAFVAGDDMHKNFASLEDVPDKLYYRNRLEVGRRYFADLWNYDPYAEIGRYSGPVLIIHGTEDPIVPVSYSTRAREIYPDAVLELIKGGGHGFSGRDLEESIDDVVSFLRRTGLIHS